MPVELSLNFPPAEDQETKEESQVEESSEDDGYTSEDSLWYEWDHGDGWRIIKRSEQDPETGRYLSIEERHHLNQLQYPEDESIRTSRSRNAP